MSQCYPSNMKAQYLTRISLLAFPLLCVLVEVESEKSCPDFSPHLRHQAGDPLQTGPQSSRSEWLTSAELKVPQQPIRTTDSGKYALPASYPLNWAWLPKLTFF